MLKEIQTTDLVFAILSTLSCYLGNPSQETYTSAQLFVSIFKITTVTIKDYIKRIMNDRMIKEQSFGAKVVLCYIKRIIKK